MIPCVDEYSCNHMAMDSKKQKNNDPPLRPVNERCTWRRTQLARLAINSHHELLWHYQEMAHCSGFYYRFVL